MGTYSLIYPRRILFGCGTISELPKLLENRRKVLLITGKSARGNGLQNRLLNMLPEPGIAPLCGIVADEAPIESVDHIVSAGRATGADAVLAVGGGSVIDAAKAAAAIIPGGGMTADYFHGSAKIAGKGLFFVAAPTTAGTGSEVTANAVLSDKKSMTKKSIRGEYLIPDIAIVDPELTFSCPASLAADSGMDAIVQAVESLVSPESNAPSRSLALKAAGLLVSHLERAVAGDRSAKIAVAEGSLLSGMSFSQTGLGAVHGLAHPIGIKYGIPHGRACGILMRSVFRMNLAKIPGLYDEAAKACGFRDSTEFLDALDRLCDATGIPANFADFGLRREDFPFILKNCRSRSMERNPCSFSDGEIEEMLEKGCGMHDTGYAVQRRPVLGCPTE